MGIESFDSWDLDNNTWGGWGKGLGTVPVDAGLHTAEEIESVGFDAYWAESARQIPDKGDLMRLQICEDLDDTWAWVALGPEKQQVAAAGALEVVKGSFYVDKDDQAVSAPVQAPQPPPAAGPAMTMT
nr:hypothetical protein [Tanacetum cinerariifolium]